MSPKGNAREKRFALVMTEEEQQQLRELAEADSRSSADCLRLLIRDAHAARFPKKTEPKKEKK